MPIRCCPVRIPLTIVVPGLVIGAAASFAGVALAPDGVTATTAATTTTAAGTTSASWYASHETVVGSAVVILDGLTTEDTQAVLRYRVLTLAPAPSGLIVLDDQGNGPGAGVAPEQWILETTDGEYPGASSRAESTEVRFDVDDSFSLGKVTGVRITRFRMRVPYGYDVSLANVPGAAFAVDDGYGVTVDNLLAQSTSVIVDFGLSHPADLFTSADPDPVRVIGLGPRWASARPRGGSGGSELTRDGPDVPDSLRLRIVSAYWVTFDRVIDLDIGALSLG
jgi:hypothetical protein